MALINPNANFLCTAYLGDETGGITFYFTCNNPGPDQPTDYNVRLDPATVTSILGLATPALRLTAWQTAIITAGRNKYRTSASLDALIGRIVVL